MDTVNTELIRGHVDTIILNSLVERDRYGYEILDIISNLSEGRYEIKQPTLYSCLKRLEKQGFISSYFGDETQGGRRRYYTLTEKGRDTLEQDQREWEFSRTIINRLLSDKEIDLKTVEAPFDPSELRPLTRRVRAYESEETAAALEPKAESAETMPSHETQSVELNITIDDLREPANTRESTSPTYTPAENAVNVENSSEEVAVKSDEIAPIPQKEPETPTETPAPAPKRVDPETLMRQQEASRFLKIGEYAEPTLLIPNENDITAVPLRAAEEEAPKEPEPQTEAPSEPIRPREPVFNPRAEEAQRILYENKPAPPTPGEYYEAPEMPKPEPDINYREALSAVYEGAEHIHNTTEVFDTNPDPSEGHAMLFGDLRQRLMDEGYRLRSYSKSNTANYYYMKFVFNNKLLKTTGLLSYIWIGILALIVYISGKTGAMRISDSVPLGIALAGLILPVITTTIWATNPKKRVKASFNSGAALIYAAIACVMISLISIVVCLLASVDFSTGIPYIPMILATIIPAFAVIYVILYRSGHYHLK